MTDRLRRLDPDQPAPPLEGGDHGHTPPPSTLAGRLDVVELAVARLAGLDTAAAAWADAYRACTPAERESVRDRVARLGVDADTWAELERLALEQDGRWPRR